MSASGGKADVPQRFWGAQLPNVRFAPGSGRSDTPKLTKVKDRFRPKVDIVHHKSHRLDESAPGHGIGLAVIGDFARFYGGEASVGKSAMSGAEIAVTIAPHPTA